MDWTVLTGLRQELYRYAKTLTREHFRAEDLVQQAFLRAMEHAQTLEGKPLGYLRGYLYKIVKNAFIDQKRREGRECLPETFPEASEALDDGRLYVQETLDRLPAGLAQIFRLRHLEGYNSREIGEMLGIPDATVRTRLRCAAQMLKRQRRDEEK